MIFFLHIAYYNIIFKKNVIFFSSPKSDNFQIENRKIDLKVESKVGSLDNVKHRPGGGDKKVFNDIGKRNLLKVHKVPLKNRTISLFNYWLFFWKVEDFYIIY